jgi:hypothetical protein
MPTVIPWPEETPTGTVYRPGNSLAVAITKLIGKVVMQEFHLPLIEAMGFQVAFPNGTVIPFPRDAYRKKPQPEARHILDDA